jgi:hypothetical protein
MESVSEARVKPQVVREDPWVTVERQAIESAGEARMALWRALGLRIPYRFSIAEVRRIAAFDQMLEGDDSNPVAALERIRGRAA